MIISVWLCASVAAAVVSLILPKIYSAKASIVPPMDVLQKGSDLAIGFGGGQSAMIGKALGVTSIAGMYAGILDSRVVLDAIIDRFDLMSVYEEKQYRSKVRNKLRSNTHINVSDEGIVSVAVEDRDPKRAAALANAYVGELDRQNKRLSAGQATSKRIFLGNRLREIEEKLSKINDILSREARIQEMLFELLTREYEIAKIEEAKSMPTIQVLDKAVPPEKRCKPRRKMLVMFSGTIALGAAVFIAFARECAARTRMSGWTGTLA